MNSLSSRKKNQKGQGMVEYALILALVGIVVFATLVLLGPSIGNVFGRINSAVSTNEPAGGDTVSNPATSTPMINLANGSVCQEDDQCSSDKCRDGLCVGGANSSCTSNNHCASNRCVDGKCAED